MQTESRACRSLGAQPETLLDTPLGRLCMEGIGRRSLAETWEWA